MKHKTILLLLALICMLGILSACKTTIKGEDDNMKNFILDPKFELGAQVYAPGKPMTYTGSLDFGKKNSDETAAWLLTQWNSKNNIRSTQGEYRNNEYVYENKYKTVALADDGTVTLRVNASEEYLSPRTKKMDRWVHLYMEQRYAKPYPIGDVEKMRLSFDFCIPYFEDHTPEGQLDPSLHASIAVFYIILKDINPDSPAYNNFINFCVMLFDNRTPVTSESWFMDEGQNPLDATNMIIYTMDSSVYTGPVEADGEWHSVDFDPLPYFKKSFEIAQKSNCMQGSRWEDMAISSVFFGFEVPGVMNSEMKIRNIFLGAHNY